MKNRINIPVFFTFDNHFVVPAIVAIFSLLKYADKKYFYSLYIVHSGISLKNQKKLQLVVSEYPDNANLTFVNSYLCSEDWSHLNSKQHYSKEIFNKLIATELFPQYDKIICSDVDVVFRGDISGSYFMYDENDQFYIAGIEGLFEPSILSWYRLFNQEEKKKLYHGIGAGYMLLNLRKMRLDSITSKMIVYYKQNLSRLIQPEQDVFNLCCYPYIKYLPYKYMVCVYDYKYRNKRIDFRKEILNPQKELEDGLNNVIQLHYAGFLKPWNSFFLQKQNIWLEELIESGYVFEFIKKIPYYLYRRLRKYSIKRYIKKQISKLA